MYIFKSIIFLSVKNAQEIIFNMNSKFIIVLIFRKTILKSEFRFAHVSFTDGIFRISNVPGLWMPPRNYIMFLYLKRNLPS